MDTDIWLTMADDVDIYVKKWSNQTNKHPKAIIQLAHGMVEHINRYDGFANFLIENNIIVYGNDHRGHGRTGERQGLLGYLSAVDGFKKTTNDLYEITKHIKQTYPTTPLFLFGHSMGSFLTRSYMQKHSEAIDGVILSGTGFHTPVMIQTGKWLASMLQPKKQSKLMNFLTFSSYNKNIQNCKTGFDWLSRDDAAVKRYIDDPLAGYIPTARFFYDLMDGLSQIQNKSLNKSIRTDIPILFVSGDADPVGNYSKGIWKTVNHYDAIGLNNITTMFFADSRHELLHELNKDEVYTAIYDWVTYYI